MAKKSTDGAEYPKHVYHPKHVDKDGNPVGRLVVDADAEAKLGAGWYETPADFPKK